MGLGDIQRARYHARPAHGPIRTRRGAVAQLGERRVRNAKVVGSIPIRSTIDLKLDEEPALRRLFRVRLVSMT